MKCCSDGYTKEIVHEEKVKVVDQHMNELRVVINLIKDCNLELEYPSSNVKMKISQLEEVKKKWRKDQLKNVNKENKRWTKRSSRTPPCRVERRALTVEKAPRPQQLQLYTPIYMQQNSSPYHLLYPRQFDAVQNANILPGQNYRPTLPQWNHLPYFGRPFYPL